MSKRSRRRKARLILAGSAGVAAVTFHGVFLSGCGSVNPCFGRDGGLCEPIDSGVDAKGEGGDASDASDGARDAPADSTGEAASDASDGG